MVQYLVLKALSMDKFDRSKLCEDISQGAPKKDKKFYPASKHLNDSEHPQPSLQHLLSVEFSGSDIKIHPQQSI